MQEINNNEPVDSQINIGNLTGELHIQRKSRFAKRFEKLNKEVTSDERYEEIFEALKYYLTELDGIDVSTKLKDGGFNDSEITNAIRKKEKYAKKLEKSKFYQSAQWIDSQLFAKIKMDFETHILPLINKEEPKEIILNNLVSKVIQPVLELLNIEGENDDFLNYDAEDIFGMVYYLTGKCHLNWKNYDSIQSGI